MDIKLHLYVRTFISTSKIWHTLYLFLPQEFVNKNLWLHIPLERSQLLVMRWADAKKKTTNYVETCQGITQKSWWILFLGISPAMLNYQLRLLCFLKWKEKKNVRDNAPSYPPLPPSSTHTNTDHKIRTKPSYPSTHTTTAHMIRTKPSYPPYKHKRSWF